MGSDLSEPLDSSETANRRMSGDMSGPLSDKPDCTTQPAQVANTCLPAGELPNKTPIFNSGVRDARTFLGWLWATCPGGLTGQLKAEKLMVVPSTANGLRATVSALRYLHAGEGVSFHTFTLPEDCCARLLVKNLGRGMPESVVREELESLDIRVQELLSCVPAVATRVQPRTTLSPPLHCIRGGGLRCPKCAQSPNSHLSA